MIGGGVVGAEMAQAYRRLGADEVVIVRSGERMLTRNEPWVEDLLGEVFAEEGITVLTGQRASRVRRDAPDGLTRRGRQ